MAASITPNEGLPALLDYLLRADIVGVFGWQLCLYVNDAEIAPGLVLTDLDECSWVGYTRYTLQRDQWTPAVMSGDEAVSTYTTTPLPWVNGGSAGVTVFGAFAFDPTALVLRRVWPFDPGDVREIEPGGGVTFLPRLTLGNLGLV